jgi:hypothetical protein
MWRHVTSALPEFVAFIVELPSSLPFSSAAPQTLVAEDFRTFLNRVTMSSTRRARRVARANDIADSARGSRRSEV